MVRSLLAALAAALVLAPAAHAADYTVTSFDGTPISAHWFPTGPTAPTVLMGPGWGGSGDVDEAPGGAIARFRGAGYNVLTWDPRGFGTSGGTAQVDSADFEGRDVQALLDWIATRPEAQLDGPGDPRAGMAGGSYGGGIQLVTAAIDKRVDAITPQIAWHSLETSLYQDSIVKLGWSGLLYLAAANARLDPHIKSAYDQGRATGALDADTRSWFAARGPGPLVDRISAPTLFVQGTVDTLFPLDEAVKNYRILRGKKVPTKLLWYCGGHGVCLSEQPAPDRVNNAVLAWLNRYVKGDQSVDTGARFDGDRPARHGLHRAGLPAAAGPAADRPRQGCAAAQGGGRRRTHEEGDRADRRHHPRPRDQRRRRAPARRSPRHADRRRAATHARLPRNDDGPPGPAPARLRPARRHADRARARQPDHPDHREARRPAPHGHAGAGDRGAHAARPRRDHAPAGRRARRPTRSRSSAGASASGRSRCGSPSPVASPPRASGP